MKKKEKVRQETRCSPDRQTDGCESTIEQRASGQECTDNLHTHWSVETSGEERSAKERHMTKRRHGRRRKLQQ